MRQKDRSGHENQPPDAHRGGTILGTGRANLNWTHVFNPGWPARAGSMALPDGASAPAEVEHSACVIMTCTVERGCIHRTASTWNG